MNTRLQEIIDYKTNGKHSAFAEFMGWTPQYLAKLIKGENFGFHPLRAVLAKMPEINARWLMFGVGDMVKIDKCIELQVKTMAHIQHIMELNNCIPIMNPKEMRIFEDALSKASVPRFSEDAFMDLKNRLSDYQKTIADKFGSAMRESVRKKRCGEEVAK